MNTTTEHRTISTMTVTTEDVKVGDLLKVSYPPHGSQLAMVVGFARRRNTGKKCLRIKKWRHTTRTWTRLQLVGGESAHSTRVFRLATRQYVEEKNPDLLTWPRWAGWNPKEG